MTIQYHIKPISLEAHLFEISLELDQPDPAGQQFWLPCWIPGSYLVREFARHIVSINASSDGKPASLRKLDKQRWQAEPVKGRLSLCYQVYAFDLSVRGAYLDSKRGFFNGTSVFLAVAGQESKACDVHIANSDNKMGKKWQVATTLPRHGAKKWEFGHYRAQNYDELIDHPVEMGEFSHIGFKACGIEHEIVIAGEHHADMARLKKDIKKICETQIRFFGEPAPFDRYIFMTLAVGDAYGGLEHRSSTALICARDDLPFEHETAIKTGYRQFLGLVSHEYFHSWNVKRIKPAAYAPYPLQQEAYTSLLWAFEGITSYYDDLMLLRAGLISQQEYLDLLAQTLTSVQRTPGRHVQTLEEASFDTWIKYYRQDENSPNSQISYYLKGALTALCLDLSLRLKTAGKKSLDDIMQALWQRFGREFDQHGRGLGEQEFESLAEEVSGLDLREFFALALRSTTDLPVGELLEQIGIRTQQRVASNAQDKGGWQDNPVPAIPTLGARTCVENGQIKLTHVLQGGAAQQAGLSAGDILIAIDYLRVSATNLETLLKQKPVGKKRTLWAFRRDELLQLEIIPQQSLQDTWGLQLADKEITGIESRKSWIGL